MTSGLPTDAAFERFCIKFCITADDTSQKKLANATSVNYQHKCKEYEHGKCKAK